MIATHTFLVAAALIAATSAQFCAVISNSTSLQPRFATINNVTGSVINEVPLAGISDPVRFDGNEVSAVGGQLFYLPNNATSSLGVVVVNGTARVVPIRAPYGYEGNFTARFLNFGVNSTRPIALLVSAASSWAAIVEIDPESGNCTARGNVTASYFGGGYAFKAGISAFDDITNTLWLCAPGGKGDIALGFLLGSPDGTAPTVLPFPEGSVVHSMKFGGPFFSGPGLVALVSNTGNGADDLSLLGSFLDEGGQPDYFEVPQLLLVGLSARWPCHVTK